MTTSTTVLVWFAILSALVALGFLGWSLYRVVRHLLGDLSSGTPVEIESGWGGFGGGIGGWRLSSSLSGLILALALGGLITGIVYSVVGWAREATSASAAAARPGATADSATKNPAAAPADTTRKTAARPDSGRDTTTKR